LSLVARWVADARALRANGQAVRTRHIVTLNPEMTMAARHDADLRALINRADLVLADGVGIVLAARLRGVRDLSRFTGVDLIEALAERAAIDAWRIFLLGACLGVADDAADRLHKRFPSLQVAGTHAGSPGTEEDAEGSGRVRAANADIVCVAYGAPAQEWWIERNRGALGAAVAIGVGGAFDFLAGQVPRAPEPLRRMGLEWAYRLWREPWRWRRMLALPRFALAAVEEALRLGRLRDNPTEQGTDAADSERQVRLT
jgi:N-acetylglucosaminyldiphosphoundecaprenol N-acetyl-beta-D-mannosaminyltransferase